MGHPRQIEMMLASLAAWSALVLPAPAEATPNFPPEIRSHLSLDYTPDCTLCHDGTPGLGTATKPFATSMRSRGLQPGDLATLITAISALDAEGIDSDNDGTPDIDELVLGTDPNGFGTIGPVPEYGCGARILGPATPAPWSFALALGALALMAVQRRRRGARPVH